MFRPNFDATPKVVNQSVVSASSAQYFADDSFLASRPMDTLKQDITAIELFVCPPAAHLTPIRYLFMCQHGFQNLECAFYAELIYDKAKISYYEWRIWLPNHTCHVSPSTPGNNPPVT